MAAVMARARTAPPPAAGYGQTGGLIIKDGRLYSWAHAVQSGRDVTLLAPVTHEFLISLIPGLGDSFLLNLSGNTQRLDFIGPGDKDHVPAASPHP